MKYIKELLIDVDLFIKKDFFNKVKINELSIPQIHDSPPKELRKIINENLDNYKKYIKETNPDDYQNVNDYDKVYDTIVERFLDQKYVTRAEAQRSFLTDDDLQTKEKIYYLEYLDPLFFKSSKYAFLLLQSRKLFSKDKLDPNIVKKLEKAILVDINLSTEYAEKILKNRWEELELRIFEKGESENFLNYFNVVLKKFFKSNNDSSKKFDEIYKESEIFRKFINHPIMISKVLSFFEFWNPTIDKILIKSPQSYLDYFFNLRYRNSDNFDFMIKNIMQDPKKIAIYYSGDSPRGVYIAAELPSDPNEKQKIFDALSQNPKQLFSFVKNRYDDDKSILKDFPNFVADASKIEKGYDYLIFNFLQRTFLERISKITDIQYWDDYKVDDYINNYKKQFGEVREYMYKTYKPFLEKISKNKFYAAKYSNFTLYPFPIKEGEQGILNDFFERGGYLSMIKKLGPELVPNYDDYDFSILD